MPEKPSYNELEEKNRQLQKEVDGCQETIADLQNSEARYRSLYEKTPIPYQSLDMDGKLLEVNPAWLDTLGFSREEVIGTSFADYLAESDLDSFKNNFATFKNEGMVSNIEFQLQKKSGSSLTVSLEGIISKDETGTQSQTHCLFHDITEHKKIENLRRKAREVWALTFDAIDDIITIQDENLRIVRANKAAHRLFQANEGELDGRHCYEVFSGKEKPCPACPLLETIQSGNEHSAIIKHENLDRVFQVSSSNIPGLNDKRDYLVHVARDITQNVEAEQALRESEERFSKAFNANPAPMVISEMDTGTFIDVNQRWMEMFGYTREELVGHSSNSLGIWVNKQERKFMISELSAKGCLREYPAMYRTKAGEVKSALKSAETISLRGQKVMLSLILDITERNEAERTLRESEEKFAQAFNSSPDSVNINRLEDGLYIEINTGFTDLTGYTREDVLGKTSFEINIWENPSDRHKLLKDLQEEGHCDNFECQFRLKDGSLRTGLMSARIILLNKVPHIISITRDISERILLETQLHQAQKMESIGRLTGGVAHDFNNILGIIIGYSEMILAEENLPQTLQGDIETILDAASRSADIVRQLLAFSRQQTIAPRVLNLNSTVEGMLKMLRRLIGEDIQLDWAPHPDLPPIKMDPAQMDQILANLCVNARDSIIGTGQIRIETTMAVLDESYCAKHPGFKPGQYVELSLEDTGCGIDKEDLKKIFEPFFTTKKIGRGTGLGLSTVYGIVKQNDGFVSVNSEPGRGTTFNIYFPRCQGEAVQAVDEASPLTQRSGKETVLLVEDDSSLLVMVQKMLEKIGLHVLTANTPVEAFQVVKAYQEDIDLLLTDVIMPEMNGKELAEHLRVNSPSLQVLFMSGYTTDVIAHSGILEEGVHFIQKPYSIKELAEKISEVLK